jgi:hypothetical protein
VNFPFSGPNSGCVLHGKLDLPVVMQKGSKWFLVDLDCAESSKFPESYELSETHLQICFEYLTVTRRRDGPTVFNQIEEKNFLVVVNSVFSETCSWPINATNIDPTSIASPMKSVNVQNHNQCQALCLLDMLQPLCHAYALSTAPFYTGYNCYLFPALTQVHVSSAASGKFVLYQNQCF